MDKVPTLVEFMAKMAGGGVVGVLVAFLLEHVGIFQRLAPEIKKWVVFSLFVILPVGAAALLENVPPEIWAILEPYWNALALGFMAWLASQVAHQWDKNRRS